MTGLNYKTITEKSWENIKIFRDNTMHFLNNIWVNEVLRDILEYFDPKEMEKTNYQNLRTATKHGNLYY